MSEKMKKLKNMMSEGSYSALYEKLQEMHFDYDLEGFTIMFKGIRKEIIKVLEFYKNGEYDTATFCNVLGGLYYFEPSGYKYFNTDERKYLYELVEVTERFSPYEEEIAACAYFSEEQVKEKFNEIVKQLKIQ